MLPSCSSAFCEGCEDEVHLACRGLAAVPDGDWFCRACQPSASAKAAARLLPATEQVYEADIERKQEVKNARGGDDEEKDDTDEDQANLCIALVYVPRGVSLSNVDPPHTSSLIVARSSPRRCSSRRLLLTASQHYRQVHAHVLCTVWGNTLLLYFTIRSTVDVCVLSALVRGLEVP